MSTCFTPEKINEAFLAATPYISQTIKDYTVQHPNWYSELYEIESIEPGGPNAVTELRFRGGRPTIERGFDKWSRKGDLTGCTPCDANNCSYNWTTFGGHGIERVTTTLMDRDFRTPEYCIKEIESTAHFKEVFAKIIENINAQVDFFKAFSIGQNFLTAISKKYVIDSGGPKIDRANPYVYPNIGAAVLSTLNINLLEFFYEHMRRRADTVPYDVVNGAPVYALSASPQLLARLYRDDSDLRQDVRFSSEADSLLSRYNFLSTIRGMFIVAPNNWPRRFNIVGGEPVEVLPYVNGVPAEVGEYTDISPDYELATHEEILLHGRNPFKILTKGTTQALPGGATFGAEPTFMESWKWINPLTECDAFQRQGFFATHATIGLSQQYSEGVFSILVTRPRVSLMAMYTPEPTCPPTPVTCNNSIPETSCPCPIVLSITPNPMDSTKYFFTFATAVTGVANDPVVLELDNGATITGTLEAISVDGKTAEISFVGGLSEGICTHIVSVYCDNSMGCSATVQSASDCRSDQTGKVKLILSNAIRANSANDIIIAYFNDCTTAELKVTAVDPIKLEWTVQYATGFGPTDDPTGAGATKLTADILCDRGGISKVCVPPTTDAACPACEVSVEACENPVQ